MPAENSAVDSPGEELGRAPSLGLHEFQQLASLLRDETGIALQPNKRDMVAGRLGRRLRHWHMESFAAYLELLGQPWQNSERQTVVDLLTTHETYFFREPHHFEFLRTTVLPTWHGAVPFRLWSAACSTGEEAYSAAMVLDANLGPDHWEVWGSDVAKSALQTARNGHYCNDRNGGLPTRLRHRYCLKGVRDQQGTFLVKPELRRHTHFRHINLNRYLPSDFGPFGAILLRNILIYFTPREQRDIVRRVTQTLCPGGWLLLGHADTLDPGLGRLQRVEAGIFRCSTTPRWIEPPL